MNRGGRRYLCLNERPVVQKHSTELCSAAAAGKASHKLIQIRGQTWHSAWADNSQYAELQKHNLHAITNYSEM